MGDLVAVAEEFGDQGMGTSATRFWMAALRAPSRLMPS